jgi:hypothetical protein
LYYSSLRDSIERGAAVERPVLRVVSAVSRLVLRLDVRR